LDEKSYLFAWIVLAGMLQLQRKTELSKIPGEDPQGVRGNEQDGKVYDAIGPAFRPEVCGENHGLHHPDESCCD
jgi:hypothetical protein